MTTAEIINIVLSSIVALTAIISIIIAIITMKQNSKMIEESTRPILHVYSKYSSQNGILYIIIKNLGQSVAFIDNVETDFYIPKEDNNIVNGNPFANLKNGSIPPNSSKMCPLVPHSLETTKFNFEISYHSTIKKYTESYFVDYEAENPFPHTNTSIRDGEKALELIAHTLQDIYKTKL